MCLNCVHNCKWLEAQISKNEYCCNRLAKDIKEFGYRRIETNLEQYSCCSGCYSICCCSNPGTMIGKIPKYPEY